MEYYLTIKKNGIMSFAGKWTELEIIMLSEISQTQKDKYHVFSHLQNLNITRKELNIKGILFEEN
jgi:hypothetical protein